MLAVRKNSLFWPFLKKDLFPLSLVPMRYNISAWYTLYETIKVLPQILGRKIVIFRVPRQQLRLIRRQNHCAQAQVVWSTIQL